MDQHKWRGEVEAAPEAKKNELSGAIIEQGLQLTLSLLLPKCDGHKTPIHSAAFF